MRPTISQYAEALEALTRDVTAERAVDVARCFWRFLERRGEQEKADAIVRYLEKSEAQRDGRVVVSVVTAFEATEERKQKIAGVTKRLFPEKKIECRYAVDGTLIGGVLLCTDEMLYDATLTAQIKALKKNL